MSAAPDLPSVDIAAIRELAGYRIWVNWRWEIRDGRWTKPPYAPQGGNASSTDPATWSTFEECVAAVRAGRFDGVGFNFAGTPYAGVDLDECLDGDGRPSDLAVEVMSLVPSYAEISPSGDGLHFIVRGSLPNGRRTNRDLGLEMYDTGRFFCTTGRWWADAPETIEECTDRLAEMHRRYLNGPGEESASESKSTSGV